MAVQCALKKKTQIDRAMEKRHQGGGPRTRCAKRSRTETVGGREHARKLKGGGGRGTVRAGGDPKQRRGTKKDHPSQTKIKSSQKSTGKSSKPQQTPTTNNTHTHTDGDKEKTKETGKK